MKPPLAALACGWLAQGRVVGGDGVRYRRRIQQAAHYVLNDTIVKSLASFMTEVERGLNMSGVILRQQKAVSFGQGWSALFQMQISSQFRWIASQRLLSLWLFILVTMWREAVAVSTFQSHGHAQLRDGPPLENACEDCAEQPWPCGLLLFGNFSKQMQILQLLF